MQNKIIFLIVAIICMYLLFSKGGQTAVKNLLGTNSNNSSNNSTSSSTNKFSSGTWDILQGLKK